MNRRQENEVLGGLYAIIGQAKILQQDNGQHPVSDSVLSVAHMIVNEGERLVSMIDQRPSEIEVARAQDQLRRDAQ